MTKDPRCCLPTGSVEAAAKLMQAQNIGSVLVCQSEQDKTLVGILTDRDIVIKVAAEGKAPASVRVEEVMSRDPICCREDDDLEEALKLMEENQVRRIPVVDEANQLVGIISQADVATRANEPKKTAEVVREISKPAAEHAPMHA